MVLFGGKTDSKAELHLELLDRTGKKVLDTSAPITITGGKTSFTIPEKTIANVAKWTAETPNLYDLFITVKSEGKTTAVVSKKVGFRRVDIKNGRLLVNGTAIRLRGVNRHEHNAKTGHRITKADILADLVLMKQHNINAIRTSHYPNMPAFYELTDEYGFYVIDEGNIETHEFGLDPKNDIANDPEWATALQERVEHMILRDRNHPSIIIWSLGNEAGDGPNMTAIYHFVKKTDPSRPFHYEGTTSDGGLFNADIGSFMYASPERVAQFIKEKPTFPLILCEYTHAMGNSNGHLAAYWNQIYADNNFQGAFVWDWIDQGQLQQVPERFRETSGKKEFLAYGGYFEDPHGLQNDGNFCMNGVISADLKPRPGLKALKFYHQYAHAEAIDIKTGKIKITNRFDFLTLDQALEARWELLENGLPVQKGTISGLNIKPYQTKEFVLPYTDFALKPGKEYHVNVLFSSVTNTFFAEKGYELAWAQFPLPLAAPLKLPDAGTVELLRSSLNGNHFAVAGKDFHVVFDMNTGRMESYHIRGEQVILAGPHLDFWRALTDNDRGGIKPEARKNIMIWKGAHHGYIKEFTINGQKTNPDIYNRVASAEKIQLAITFELPAIGANSTFTYDIFQDGKMDITVDYSPGPNATPEQQLPRFGTRLELSPGFDQMQWFGRGPTETYTDRNLERVGVYSSTVANEWVEYSRPQENGNKVDVRWVKYTDKNGLGVKFTADSLIATSASHYNREDIERSRYTWQMQPLKSVYVNIDLKQMGVGGIDSWTPRALPEPPFRIKNEPMRFKYRIEPVYTK
jgi:beta-galactosidase